MPFFVNCNSFDALNLFSWEDAFRSILHFLTHHSETDFILILKSSNV